MLLTFICSQPLINPQEIYCTLIVITYIAHVQTSGAVANIRGTLH